MTSPHHSPRVLIAEDHQLVAETYRSFLEPDYQVIGIVNDGQALLREAGKLQPDIVLVDIAMPVLNGLDAGEQVKKQQPEIQLVFLTTTLDPEVVAEAFRRGASAYVPKSAAAHELVTALEAVQRGRTYLSPLVAKDTVELLLHGDTPSGNEPKLTARQREVLQALVEGRTMQEAAESLRVRPGTIAFHKYRMLHRLNLKTTTDLLHYAIKHHLVPE